MKTGLNHSTPLSPENRQICTPKDQPSPSDLSFNRCQASNTEISQPLKGNRYSNKIQWFSSETKIYIPSPQQYAPNKISKTGKTSKENKRMKSKVQGFAAANMNYQCR